jgi:replicative superfamily II helicase
LRPSFEPTPRRNELFDTETVRLIQGAEPLEDLDLNLLPQFLTEAYSKVVAARLGAVELGDGRRESEWAENLEQLRKLADTYEGLAVFLPEQNPHRQSCAFVAGSAHHTLSQARLTEARLAGTKVETPSLTAHGVGTEVAACLLFLLAGQQADAAETTKLFKMRAHRPGESELLRGLSALASGDGQLVRTLLSSSSTPPEEANELDYVQRAAEALWNRLAYAVRLIARGALGLTADEAPDAVIESVLETLGSSRREIDELGVVVRPSLAGPYHVAKLLRAVSSKLLGTAVARVPPPTGVDSAHWNRFIRYFASRRPFLWRNHANAFAQGFLEPRNSFVLTFPTGAGKTTATELRIAAELLRGRKVVYLVPTRALVDQVSQDLSERLKPIAGSVVRGRFLEDFGENAAGRVFVHTPEQCLAYLSFEEDAHADIGLVVVDEAHQISGELPPQDGSQPMPGRRAVDAMWTLLSLLQRSPDSDVVLISAMVRNGKQLAEWLGVATSRPAQLLEIPWKPTRQVRGVVVYESTHIGKLQQSLYTLRQERSTGQQPRKADKEGIEAQPIGLFCHTQVWATDSGFAKFPILPVAVPLAVNRHWSITANRNQVGGRLLGAMAKANMRPIVFSQRVGWTANIADAGAAALESEGVAEVELNTEERALIEAAARELGSAEHVEGLSGGRVGVHHGLLLWPERAAVESAFRRADGLLGLVATPTVAQGINLPAEAVVIAGDDRWTGDIDEGGMQPLAVHELLNAAGRAGRAGHYAHGIVIDLPGKLLTVSHRERSYEVTHLEHIMSLFGLPDQCLDIVDPITQVIDRVQSAGVDAEVSKYVIRRAAGLPEEQLVRILAATLGNTVTADREAKAASQASLLRSLGESLDEEQEDVDELDLDDWRKFASQVGVSPMVAARTAARISAERTVESWGIQDLLDFALLEVTRQLFALINPWSSGLARIIPRNRVRRDGTNEEEPYEEWEDRWRTILPDLLNAWMKGEPVSKIGTRAHRHRGADGRVNVSASNGPLRVRIHQGPTWRTARRGCSGCRRRWPSAAGCAWRRRVEGGDLQAFGQVLDRDRYCRRGSCRRARPAAGWSGFAARRSRGRRSSAGSWPWWPVLCSSTTCRW